VVGETTYRRSEERQWGRLAAALTGRSGRAGLGVATGKGSLFLKKLTAKGLSRGCGGEHRKEPWGANYGSGQFDVVWWGVVCR
jgi:hypothetical protein